MFRRKRITIKYNLTFIKIMRIVLEYIWNNFVRTIDV